jgi:hypothetical protein
VWMWAQFLFFLTDVLSCAGVAAALRCFGGGVAGWLR